jgi:cyclopropane-fatty-acyl-phospholipid synthase
MPAQPRPVLPSSEWAGPAPDQRLGQRYSVEEDKAQTNVHYEQPPEFFYAFTGGVWNTYSCNLWDTGATDDTASQEAKLDLFAELMRLQPGQRILDVGCGWGGPLSYLSKRYGVKGVGLTLSPTQKRYAEQRIAAVGADVVIHECHWQDFTDDEPFDAVYTDEVIVHFSDIGGFFQKAYDLLKPGGWLVNKELHYANGRYKNLSRADVFVNEIYGLTGNYRILGEELVLLDRIGFSQQNVHQMSMENYWQTADHWLSNMHAHREELHALVGVEYYRRFRTYLKIVRKMTRLGTMTLDVVASCKL